MLGDQPALPLTGPCGFSQSASPDAIKSEDYPFTAPVYVYLAPYRCPSWSGSSSTSPRSETAERIVQGAGYVNQSLTRTPLNLQGDRLSNAIRAAGEDVTLEALQAMMTRLDGAERLSPTFRFADGAAELDTQSRASVVRLAAAIEAGFFDGRTLLFAGFSDSAGSAQINARLAQRRAETVLGGRARRNRQRRRPRHPARRGLRRGPADGLRGHRLGQRREPQGRGLGGVEPLQEPFRPKLTSRAFPITR
jgi:phosphate transport system substrate-binding protein